MGVSLGVVLTVPAEVVSARQEASVTPEDARDTDPGEDGSDASCPALDSRGFNKSRMCDRDEPSFFMGVVVAVDVDMAVLLSFLASCGFADTRFEMLYLLDRGVATMVAGVAGVSFFLWKTSISPPYTARQMEDWRKGGVSSGHGRAGQTSGCKRLCLSLHF